MMLLQQEYFFSKQLEIEIFENYCISRITTFLLDLGFIYKI